MKQFAMCLGVVAILLMNVMDVFSVGGGALLDRPCYGLPKNVRVVMIDVFLFTHYSLGYGRSLILSPYVHWGRHSLR